MGGGRACKRTNTRRPHHLDPALSDGVDKPDTARRHMFADRRSVGQKNAFERSTVDRRTGSSCFCVACKPPVGGRRLPPFSCPSLSYPAVAAAETRRRPSVRVPSPQEPVAFAMAPEALRPRFPGRRSSATKAGSAAPPRRGARANRPAGVTGFPVRPTRNLTSR